MKINEDLKMTWRILVIILAAFSISGCHYEPEADYLGPTSLGKYKLDTGDIIRLVVYEQPELTRTYVVNSQGRVSIPLAGSVRARGRTVHDLKHAVKSLLGREYVKNPQVSVEIVTYRPFFILGEVRNAGRYSYVNNLTVEAAVALAGGYSDRAETKEVRITRKTHKGLHSKIVKPNYLVKPGDTIVVKERWF